ncbi:hypothetical protein MIND_01131600 [Mycena indigotica]|uniref:Uncharacterized protein n=1 Tax=Mycena indigotica TaxID=2126181 RepID=A0A8H6S849_9AGAR|nr:uncharacterized protein MIND_01131600 [Mycena indigotica]KAF7293532.1 hypothetical protein MIND_01131600 [Mycena indigotica]
MTLPARDRCSLCDCSMGQFSEPTADNPIAPGSAICCFYCGHTYWQHNTTQPASFLAPQGLFNNNAGPSSFTLGQYQDRLKIASPSNLIGTYKTPQPDYDGPRMRRQRSMVKHALPEKSATPTGKKGRATLKANSSSNSPISFKIFILPLTLSGPNNSLKSFSLPNDNQALFLALERLEKHHLVVSWTPPTKQEIWASLHESIASELSRYAIRFDSADVSSFVELPWTFLHTRSNAKTQLFNYQIALYDFNSVVLQKLSKSVRHPTDQDTHMLFIAPLWKNLLGPVVDASINGNAHACRSFAWKVLSATPWIPSKLVGPSCQELHCQVSTTQMHLTPISGTSPDVRASRGQFEELRTPPRHESRSETDYTPTISQTRNPAPLLSWQPQSTASSSTVPWRSSSMTSTFALNTDEYSRNSPNGSDNTITTPHSTPVRLYPNTQAPAFFPQNPPVFKALSSPVNTSSNSKETKCSVWTPLCFETSHAIVAQWIEENSLPSTANDRAVGTVLAGHHAKSTAITLIRLLKHHSHYLPAEEVFTPLPGVSCLKTDSISWLMEKDHDILL